VVRFLKYPELMVLFIWSPKPKSSCSSLILIPQKPRTRNSPILKYFENWEPQRFINTGCVTLWAFAIYSKKDLKAKEELWKPVYFTMQKYNLQKNPLKKSSKRNQNPSRYYNPITLESKKPIKINGQNHHHMEDKREGQKEGQKTHSPQEPKNPLTL